MNNSMFLGQEYFAYDSYYPRGCFRHKHKRILIAITPSDEVTNAMQRNIYLWSKQFHNDVTLFIIVDHWRLLMGYFMVQQVQTFNKTQEIFDYVQSDDYDTIDKPGICFAIEHISKDNGTSHEFKLMFNDQESEDEHN